MAAITDPAINQSEFRRGAIVKFVKLLTVPAVFLLSLALAVPAFAHSATITNLTASCNSDHKVCFDFDVTTSGLDSTGRDVLVDLINAQTNQVLETRREHLAIDTTHVHDCFSAVVSTTTKLTIKIRVPNGSDLDLGDSQTSVDTQGCVPSQTPTPTPTTPTPTPTQSTGGTPTATATTLALAQTGGFDYRFPLLGLVLLVAGGVLFVVSASRGRSAGTK